MATLCDTRSISHTNYSEYDEEWLNRNLVTIQTVNKRDAGSEAFTKSCHPESKATFPLGGNDETFLKTLGVEVWQALIHPKKQFSSARFGAEETYANNVKIALEIPRFMRQINLAQLDDEELLDWDFISKIPPPKKSTRIIVEFKESGRSKPIQNFDPFE